MFFFNNIVQELSYGSLLLETGVLPLANNIEIQYGWYQTQID